MAMATAFTKTVLSRDFGEALTIFVLCLIIRPLNAVSEPGKWIVKVNSRTPTPIFFAKTMFNASTVEMKLSSSTCDPPVNLSVSWYLRSSRCYDEVFGLTSKAADDYFGLEKQSREGAKGYYIFHQYKPIECKTHMTPDQFTVSEPLAPNPLKPFKDRQEPANTQGRRRRETEKAGKPQKTAVKAGEQKDQGKGAMNQMNAASHGPRLYEVARTWEDAPYMFMVQIKETDGQKNSDSKWEIELEVCMPGPHDYISASEWPLMIFYMVMCIIYVLLGVLWLGLSACYWRDLLRIQFWIGGVIFLGMLEKAVYYAEFQSIRYDGLSVQGAVVFAEVLSAVKRTLARVLVIIASLGYGIVKPRLGALLHRVVGVGLLYLIFSIVEGVLRVNSAEDDLVLLAAIPLAVLDSALCWWIFVSLAQTMKLLRLRRNVVKLSLYRHFTNTLIFAVIASVVFIIWTTKTFKLSQCQSDWRELWIDDAFWRFLFSLILLVIMFLWRPSANNQRYAFSPLVDELSEEEEAEKLMNEAFEGVKMRGVKSETNGSAKPNKVDEDLKWVEENIPSSMADVALPPLLDSDEETMTTKFEMSKME
ncbi:transmembrane protein 87A [Chanos chanos]|uniref:Transmembrane protein 87A n=1 Tax=Chanos chanos TaxID=29144 RepID=A0A6J2VLW5_CHACN|nr:transmembrane protein 87A-like [Chanos chanos]